MFDFNHTQAAKWAWKCHISLKIVRMACSVRTWAWDIAGWNYELNNKIKYDTNNCNWDKSHLKILPMKKVAFDKPSFLSLDE